MEIVALARQAMATRFEIVLHGENAANLRAAGEEALSEVERIERQLSLYRPDSEIARVNASAAQQPVKVSPPVFRLLEQAQRLHTESTGAFDITIAPLVRCWGFMGGTGHRPEAAQLAEARALVGMNHLVLNSEDFTVRFDREGVMLDFGAIGKGYAIDCAVETLREAGVTSALIHGGTSTVYGLGVPLDAEAWKVAVAKDVQGEAQAAVVTLRDEALSVSAVWGKSFAEEGKTFGHVLDPRTGEPVTNAVLAAVAIPSATETDALSTALLVLGAKGSDIIAKSRPMRTMVLTREGEEYRAQSAGMV